MSYLSDTPDKGGKVGSVLGKMSALRRRRFAKKANEAQRRRESKMPQQQAPDESPEMQTLEVKNPAPRRERKGLAKVLEFLGIL